MLDDMFRETGRKCVRNAHQVSDIVNRGDPIGISACNGPAARDERRAIHYVKVADVRTREQRSIKGTNFENQTILRDEFEEIIPVSGSASRPPLRDATAAEVFSESVAA